MKKWDDSILARKVLFLVTDMSNVDFLRIRLEWRNDDLHHIVLPHMRDLRIRAMDAKKHQETLNRVKGLERIMRRLREDSIARESRERRQQEQIELLLKQLLQQKNQETINLAATSKDPEAWKEVERTFRETAPISDPMSKRKARDLLASFKEEVRANQLMLGRMLPAPPSARHHENDERDARDYILQVKSPLSPNPPSLSRSNTYTSNAYESQRSL